MATGFGLLHLPKMPELKNRPTTFFQPFQVDLNNIAYKDKAREKMRREKLEAYRETGVWPGKVKNAPKKKEAWSEKKAEKAQKKEKKRLKREGKERREKRKRAAVDHDEWDELAKEARQLKKFKSKKITRKELKMQFDETVPGGAAAAAKTATATALPTGNTMD